MLALLRIPVGLTHRFIGGPFFLTCCAGLDASTRCDPFLGILDMSLFLRAQFCPSDLLHHGCKESDAAFNKVRTELGKTTAPAFSPPARCLFRKDRFRSMGAGLMRSARRGRRMVAACPQRFEVPFDFYGEQIVQQGRNPSWLFSVLAAGIASRWNALWNCRRHIPAKGAFSRAEWRRTSQRQRSALGLAQEPRLLLLGRAYQISTWAAARLLDYIPGSSTDEGVTVPGSGHARSSTDSGTFSSCCCWPDQEIRKGDPPTFCSLTFWRELDALPAPAEVSC